MQEALSGGGKAAEEHILRLLQRGLDGDDRDLVDVVRPTNLQQPEGPSEQVAFLTCVADKEFELRCHDLNKPFLRYIHFLET